MICKHTPGPWSIKQSTVHSRTLNIMVEGDVVSGLVASISIDWPQHDQSVEQHANARLISAAPDMLDLLIQLEDECRPAPAFGEAYYPVWALFDAVMKKMGGDK